MGAVCCKSSLEKVDAEKTIPKSVAAPPLHEVQVEKPEVETIGSSCCHYVSADPSPSASEEEAESIEGRLAQSPKWKRGANVREVYKFGKTLGTGGFAIVKLVTHRKTLKEYACKIMSLPDENAEVGENENSRGDVFKEIEILCGMEHENVIHLKEFYTEDHRVYLITDLLTGGELLDAVLERGNYSEADACMCFQQLVRGIGYLHSKGVVHRDLKLENLLIASPDEITDIKIVDFGLARLNGKHGGKMGTVCGTPQYVAPEVIQSSESITAYGQAVDMWSAGVVLFILLGGYPPFHHDNESILFEQIRQGHYSFGDSVWDNISETAKDLIKKLLTTDPDVRLSAEQCLQHPWFSLTPSSTPLNTTTANLKKNYRRQFRKAVNVVLTINKMKRLTIAEDDSARMQEESVA